MQVVLLDAETLGPDDLDFSPLSVLKHDLSCHQNTQPEQVVERLVHAQIVLVNKVVLDASCLDQLPQFKHIIVLG